ncbi:MAG TPA: FAD-dependent oxidoreductase [Candidatus Saccharimonadales bacterium]|nr:FAD-dependent oxidoreductase [Candidatus Saccharimonadales bacterium]
MGQTFKVFLIALPILCLVACLNKQNVEKKPKVEIEYALQHALKQENVIPVVIIGSGPSGLSAALYMARAGMKAFVFAGPIPCGQLTQTTYIENWPGRTRVLGSELMDDIKKQAQSFGATIINDAVSKIDFSQWPFALETEEGRRFKAMSVIVATGATPRGLNIPGEREFWGKGVTTCAVCDAPFFKGKEVVIAGGGDSACEMIFELAPHVKKVTMLVRKEAMRAAVAMQKRVFSYPNASVEYNKEITAVYGEKGEVVAIDVYDNKEKKTQRRSIDGVFLAIGHDPNNKLLKGGAIELDENGYLVMNGRTQECSLRGVFAAGEIQDSSYRQAIVAAGEGVKAALDATSFLYSLGFTAEIGEQLDKKFFENFSDEKTEMIEISEKKELNDLVLNAKGVVILDFYGTNCPTCVRMIPSLEAVAHKLSGQVKIYKVLFVNNSPIHKILHWNHDIKIKKVPSLLIFKDGKFMDMTQDFMTKVELLEYVKKFL